MALRSENVVRRYDVKAACAVSIRAVSSTRVGSGYSAKTSSVAGLIDRMVFWSPSNGFMTVRPMSNVRRRNDVPRPLRAKKIPAFVSKLRTAGSSGSYRGSPPQGIPFRGLLENPLDFLLRLFGFLFHAGRLVDPLVRLVDGVLGLVERILVRCRRRGASRA